MENIKRTLNLIVTLFLCKLKIIISICTKYEQLHSRLTTEDIQPDKQFIAAPFSKSYSMKKGIEVVSLTDLIQKLSSD